jgi:hypothetical protein
VCSVLYVPLTASCCVYLLSSIHYMYVPRWMMHFIVIVPYHSSETSSLRNADYSFSFMSQALQFNPMRAKSYLCPVVMVSGEQLFIVSFFTNCLEPYLDASAIPPLLLLPCALRPSFSADTPPSCLFKHVQERALVKTRGGSREGRSQGRQALHGVIMRIHLRC